MNVKIDIDEKTLQQLHRVLQDCTDYAANEYATVQKCWGGIRPFRVDAARRALEEAEEMLCMVEGWLA